MKICKRGKKNIIFVCFICFVFILFSAYSIYSLYNPEITIGEVMTQYGVVKTDWRFDFFGAILFTSVTIYLIFYIKRTVNTQILFDDNRIIFCFDSTEERNYSWEDVIKPNINVSWVVTDYVPKRLRI